MFLDPERNVLFAEHENTVLKNDFARNCFRVLCCQAYAKTDRAWSTESLNCFSYFRVKAIPLKDDTDTWKDRGDAVQRVF